MKEVKINISAAGFPSQFVSDSEKATQEFGLQIGQAIQYEWFRKDGGGCRYYNQWRDFNRLRLYARGEQSVAKYKNELAIDGDLSYLNLDWTPVPILPKFVDIVVNGMSDRLFTVKAYAQDAMSAEKRNQYQDVIEGDMVAREALTKMSEAFGINPEDISEGIIKYPMINLAVDEVIVLKAVDKSKIETIKEALNNHVEKQIKNFENYVPQNSEILKNHILKTQGNYILLAVSRDAEKIETIFDNMLNK